MTTKIKAISLILAMGIAIGGLLAGCDHQAMTDQSVTRSVHYFQDKRTGICYAIMDSGMHGTGIALVPCEKVQQLLDNPWTR